MQGTTSCESFGDEKCDCGFCCSDG